MNRVFLNRITCLLFLLLLPAVTCLGDDGRRGRLADGRAFRTDGQGNQLVDYIAELEVNVENLNRRVQGLEDEVIEKQQAIDRLKAGKDAEPRITERDLMKQAGAPAHQADSFAMGNLAEENRKNAALLEKQQKDHELELAAYRSEIANLKEDLNSRASELDSTRNTSEGLHKQLRNEASEARQSAEALQARLEAENNRHERELAGEREKAVDLAKELREKSTQVENLQVEYRQATEEVSRMQRADERRADEQRARVAVPAEAAPALIVRHAEEQTSGTIGMTAARTRALDAIRGSMTTELNQIGTLVQTRDRLVGQYGTSKGNLSFKPGAPVSHNNLGVGQIRAQIAGASSVRELSALRQDVSQIRGRMQEDIALIRRMFNVR